MSLVDLVVVGASLGGLDALPRVLADLAPASTVPIGVVQHRRPDLGSRLAKILADRAGRRVIEPEDGTPIEPGCVYLAPGDYHLLVDAGRWSLSIDPPVTFARPSIDVLFESAAIAYGPRVAAVLLTASSDDGAAGIAAVAARGGITVVEDPASAESPVAGRAAIARTRVRHVLPLGSIGPFLVELLAREVVER